MEKINVESSIIIADIKGAQLEESTEKILIERFIPFEEQAKEWMEKAQTLVVSESSQKAEMKQARELRLAFRKIRLDVDKTHDFLKSDIRKKGQTLDLIKRKLTGLIEPIEEHLQAQEDFDKIQEEKRIANLKVERIEALRPYVDSIMLTGPYEQMSEDAFNNFLENQKIAFNTKQEAKALEDKEILKKKKQQEAEQVRIREENDKLRIENEKKEKNLQKERDERKRLENEKREREQKEDKERKAKQDAERKLKRAPDKTKLSHYAVRVEAFHSELSKSKLVDEEAQNILDTALLLIENAGKVLKEGSESL